MSDAAAVAELPSITEQIGRVCELDPYLLDLAGREAATLPDDLVTEYSEFQSGGWKTLSLYNDSGNPHDATIHDCEARETTLLERMPATRELLRSFGLRYMWARIARLQPNSYLWEHRDYGELADVERHRLHIPLHTNASSALVVGGVRVHMAYGHLWRLLPIHPHGACNLTGPTRIHIIMDCYADEVFNELTSGIALTDADARVLPDPDKSQMVAHLDNAVMLIRLGYRDAAESSLLRLFYSYRMPEGTVYDLLVSAHHRADDPKRAEFWQDKKNVMLELE